MKEYKAFESLKDLALIRFLKCLALYFYNMYLNKYYYYYYYVWSNFKIPLFFVHKYIYL